MSLLFFLEVLFFFPGRNLAVKLRVYVFQGQPGSCSGCEQSDRCLSVNCGEALQKGDKLHHGGIASGGGGQ